MESSPRGEAGSPRLDAGVASPRTQNVPATSGAASSGGNGGGTAKDYRDAIRNKRQTTVVPELQSKESIEALPMRMSEACTLRRHRSPTCPVTAPYKITVVGPNDGSEAELVSVFVNGEGAAGPLSSSASSRGTGSSKEGDQEMDLYLSSWKKKFAHAGKELLLELHAGLQTQSETALDKSANVHIHDQFESTAGFMFIYDVTSRKTFAEVMRVHSLIVRSKNVDKAKAKGLIPMIVLANTRSRSEQVSSATPAGPAPGALPNPMVSITSPDGSDVALSSPTGTSSSVATAAAAGAELASAKPQREVTTEEGMEFAYACNCPFYEISSTNYADVLNAFQQLLGEIMKDRRRKAAAIDGSTGAKLTRLGLKGNWRKSQLASLVSASSSPPLTPPSSPPMQPRVEPTLLSSREADTDKDSPKTQPLTSSTSSARDPESKEDLHESLKDRQKAFRYTRIDTEEIKFLPPLDAEPNSKPRIRAATLPKLIEKLTYPKYPDTDLVATFLLTYRSFTTPEELLHFIVRRYEITPPADLDKEGLRLWEASEMLPIRLRVINVLKSWISDHFYDFYDSKTLLDMLKSFIDKQLSLPTNLKGPLQQLRKSIDTNEMERRARKEYMFSSKPPKSVISKKVAKAKPQEIDLRDIDPIEMARQLTLIDYDLLSRITAKEWLAHNEWANNKGKKKDDDTKPVAPNLVAMINHFNCVSKWVATEIVRCAKIKNRVLLTKKFIEVAQHCLKLNNFNMLMAIVTGGLGNVSVYRLKYSWKSLPKKTLIAYEELKTLCDSLSNFINLRTAIKTSVPPTIPYLGLYLSDLMYIEDGNADEVEGGLINFEKRRLKAEIIKDLQHFQTSPYCLTEIPVLQYYFRSLDYLTEAELYRLSCLLEPHSRQRGSSLANAPARGMADQLSSSGIVDLMESSDGEIQIRREKDKDKDASHDDKAARYHVSSDEDLLGRDGAYPSSSPPPSSPFSQMTRAVGFTPSGLALSYFDVPLRGKGATATGLGERGDSERTPRVGAVLRAQAKVLESVANSFSFADVTRATAVIDVLRRWEAQIAARKLFIVKDHSDFAGADDDGNSSNISAVSDSTASAVDGQARKQSGSKRKERADKGSKAARLQRVLSVHESQHHRTFSFEEVVMESRAVEITIERFLQTATIEGILEATRADPFGGGWLAALEAFLHKRLLGGQRPAFVTELLFALVKLLDKGSECFDAAAVAGMVGLYKKQPIRLAAHFVIDEAEAELAERHDRLVALEDSEGVRTIQSYTKEVRLAFQILNLEKRILQTIKASRPDRSMLYEALCVDREVWHRTQEVLLHTHSPRSATGDDQPRQPRTGEATHKIIGELIQLVDKHLNEVSREDTQRFNESYEDAMEEYFEWMGAYLQKLWDKLVLIHKRMEKIVQMKEAATGRGDPAFKNGSAIKRAANAWREKDLVHLQALIAAVDQAETTINRFLESCPASSPDGFDVTEDELKELLSQNNVFEQIIKMRRLQKTLEEQHARIADM